MHTSNKTTGRHPGRWAAAGLVVSLAWCFLPSTAAAQVGGQGTEPIAGIPVVGIPVAGIPVAQAAQIAEVARVASSAVAAEVVVRRAGTRPSAVWAWPTPSHRVVNPYVAPASRYGPGHRGIDILAPVGSSVVAPADGVVAFVGSVAGRPLITVDQGGALVSTLEPVRSDAAVGDEVGRGEAIGTVSRGGHAAKDTVHFGVRRDGDYINPLLRLGGIAHAVLLPCCQ